MNFLRTICQYAAVVALCFMPGIVQADHLSGEGQGGRVVIYDHGLQVPIYHLDLPPGWQVNHNIATDLTDVWRMFSAYDLDFFGPQGEVATHLFPAAVYPSMGQD